MGEMHFCFSLQVSLDTKLSLSDALTMLLIDYQVKKAAN